MKNKHIGSDFNDFLESEDIMMKCEYCNKKTKDRVRLSQHLGLSINKRVKTIECVECDKVKDARTITLMKEK